MKEKHKKKPSKEIQFFKIRKRQRKFKKGDKTN